MRLRGKEKASGVDLNIYKKFRYNFNYWLKNYKEEEKVDIIDSEMKISKK